MFARTPRDWNVFKSGTSERVGPTTYILCDSQPLKNRVPFLSTDIRKLETNKFYTEAVYTLPVEKIQGGVSPRFTSPRGGVEESPSPGPADYDVVPDPNRSRYRPQSVGKLYLCKVPLSGRRSGPSVPTKINQNGYWLDKEGNIYKMPPDFHDTSLGPAFYRMKEDTSYSYKGCKWSKRTSKRTSYKIENYPGPSDYDIEPPINYEKVKDEQFREIARKKTFLPRYLEQMQCKYTREDLPGPADYNIPNKMKCNICPGIFPKPFISGSRRFKNEVNENPSPDSYDIKRFKYSVSKKAVAFSKSAPRFAQRKAYTTPGPSDYFIRSSMHEKFFQKYNEVGAEVAPFGCSTGRDFQMLPKDSYYYPSPAEYHVVTKNKCKIPVSSVFQSKVKRFSVDCNRKMTDADLEFDPVKAFKSVKNKKYHNAFHIPFNTTAPCIRLFDIEDNEEPGPPDYEIDKESEIERCKGFIMAVSPRFPNAKDCFPGPDYYRIHPKHTNAIYKAFDTYNLTIKESIMKRKLKKHPRETWRKWAATLKKNKQLKWFVKGGVNYVHC